MTTSPPKPQDRRKVRVSVRREKGPEDFMSAEPLCPSLPLWDTCPQAVIDLIDLAARAAEVHGEPAIRKVLAELAAEGSPSSAAEPYTETEEVAA